MTQKYRTLFHYIDDSKWAIQDLELRRIKTSLFNAVNDPQELCAYTLDRYSGEQIERLKTWITNTKALLCFCRDGHNDHMWNKYGGGHRGVCFAIQVPSKFLLPVKYVKTVETGRFPDKLQDALSRSMESGRPPSDDVSRKCIPHIIPFFTTKFEGEWSHEREIRVLLNRDEITRGEDGTELYFSDFKGSGLYLSEVILGRDCPECEPRIRELVARFPRLIKVYREGKA